MGLDLSIVVPAYNEELRIGPTLREINRFFKERIDSFEIIVVDDGSLDGTSSLVGRLKNTYENLRLITLDVNCGKGAAVKQGMLAAKGKIVVMCDADRSFNPNQIEKVIEPLLEGLSDLSIGSRYIKGAISESPIPAYRKVWSRFTNKVVQWLLIPGIEDTQCGLKAFENKAAKEIFQKTTVNGWAFDLEVLVLARILNFKITEVPVTWRNDPRSKVNPIADAIAVTREMFSIRKRYSC